MKRVFIFVLILMMIIPVQAFGDVLPQELPKKEKSINGVFEIAAEIDNQWIKLGELGFGKFQETKEIDCGDYLKGEDALIRITQNGGGASYLDAVFLDGVQAVKANGSEGKVLSKLSKEDLDVTPVEDGITLEFKVSGNNGILSVTGRIEPVDISKEPLQFPLLNTPKNKDDIKEFYTYEINSNFGTVIADGNIEEIKGKDPLVEEFRKTGSGHPFGYVYFWVMNDEENLYVTMDVTVDNTYDGDKDYGKVYINTSEGIKEYKVSVPETKWGNTSFTYTDKVPYEHKVYEFKIPLSELGNQDEIEIAFAVYGTAVAPDHVYFEDPDIAYGDDYYLSVFACYVYSGGSSGMGSYICGEILDENGNVISDKFLIYKNYTYNKTPTVAYDEEHECFLVVWSEEIGEEGTYLKACTVDISDIDNPIIGAPFSVSGNDNMPGTYFEYYPDLAYGENGQFLLVWQQDYSVVHGRLINSQGTMTTENFSLPSDEYQYSPKACYDFHNDAYIVTWESDNSIEAQIVKSSGEVPLDGFISIAENGMYPHVSTNNYDDSENQFFVTWFDYNENNIKGQFIELDQHIPKKVGSSFIIASSDEISYPCFPVSHSDGNSNMLCTWVPITEGYYYAKLQYIDKNGNFIGDAFYTDNEEEDRDRLSIDPQIGIAGDNKGSIIIAYKHRYVPEPGEYDPGELEFDESVEYTNSIGYRIFGEPQPPEPPALVAEIEPDLAYHSDLDIYLSVFTGYNPDTYSGGDYIYGQLVDNKGKPIGERFLINDGTDNEDPDDDGELQSPSVAVDSDNNFLVAWSQSYSYDKIYACKLEINKSGNTYDIDTGTAFKVSNNDSPSIHEAYPGIAYDSLNDRFLIVWQQYDSTGGEIDDSWDIYGSIVEIDGDIINIIEDTFPIANAENTEEEHPSVSYSIDDNKYLITWQDWEWYSEGDDYVDNLYLKAAVIGDGGEIDSDNTFAFAENAYNPNVSYNYTDHKFLITWSDANSNEIWGAYYKIQNDTPGIISDEFVISSVDAEEGMSSVYPAAYFDGKDKMLCVWNPGTFGAYAQLRYIGSQGPTGKTFNTNKPEIVDGYDQIAIAGNLKGEFLIAYEKGQEYGELYIFNEYEDIPSIGYRIISEPKVEPPTRRDSTKPEVIGQIIVDGKVLKNIYSDDLVSNNETYSFEATKTGNVAKLWLLGSYYKSIAKDNPNGILQLTWDAASYNLPLKSEEVLNQVNNIKDSRVNIILEKVDDKELIDTALAALEKLGGKMVSGLVDYSVTVEGESKEVRIDKYNMYVSRTMDNLNDTDAYSTSAMKLTGDEFTFAPSVFDHGTARIHYRGNGVFAIVNNPKSFSDVANHWSKMNVEKLAARNIAFGKSEGIFAPDDYVTRAEFAVMITRALAITEEEGTVNFEDVSGWYEKDISTAYSAGIINGRDDGKFYPNERIKRKDMAVMICNALRFAGKEITVENEQEILAKFVDNSTIDEYARGSVAYCAKAGIIMGRDTKDFDPDGNATRAEATAIIERMLRYLDFIN